MQILSSVLTLVLLFIYLILWFLKRRELLATTGVDANVFRKSAQPLQRFFADLQIGLKLGIGALLLWHTVWGDTFILSQTLSVVDKDWLHWFGFGLGIMGLSLCRLAQITMGNSWRVGIDAAHKTDLVTHGVYHYIRNPTYTGLIALCAGLWLLNPTVLYSYWILIFCFMLEVQVRCEEEFLLAEFGNRYADYHARTKRYLPFLY
jgi:protein-S-isoprenylcysteine O-methyltransferase Ste14